MTSSLENHFPKLTNVEAKVTSPPDISYNCIAWAFKDNRRHWWPNQKTSYWPLDASGKSVAQAFEEWFLLDGWAETESHELEEGYEKVALYVKDGQPTHAARQLDSGLWSSKLGSHVDLVHALEELEGPVYGELSKIYRKRQT